jgi:macrolide transport system ATP-binding/permease protein
MTEPLIVLDKLSRVYASGETTVVALDRVDIAIAAGEMVAIVGAARASRR